MLMLTGRKEMLAAISPYSIQSVKFEKIWQRPVNRCPKAKKVFSEGKL